MSIEIISETIAAEAAAIENLVGKIETRIVEAADICIDCHGRVIVCGLGKSGLVGRKISATLASTGTSSIFVHAAEALHGDLGMVGENDCAILISKSGLTPEILKLIPTLKRLGVKIIAITGGSDSPLAEEADVILDIGVSSEAEPIGIVPTTSTIVTMAIGDALAVALMTRRGFTREDFALFHPGGNLGHLLKRVFEVMHSCESMPIVGPEASLMEGISIMSAKRLGHVIIAKNGDLIGIFSDGDLRRALQSHPHEDIVNMSLTNFATMNPVVIGSDAIVEEAVHIMEVRKITALPVIDGGVLVGLVHLHDILESRVV